MIVRTVLYCVLYCSCVRSAHSNFKGTADGGNCCNLHLVESNSITHYFVRMACLEYVRCAIAVAVVVCMYV